MDRSGYRKVSIDMNDKVLILNEFEENENIEEVFYDLTAFT